MKNNPLVTVLMSVYNGDRFLESAIESILNQTYKDFEFLIYDDCSSDNTAQIIEKYSNEDNRIICIRNKQNCGLTHNLKEGVLRAKGKYIVRMDADDIAFPKRLQTQVDYMEENLDVTVMGTSYIPFCDSNYGKEVKQPTGQDAIKCELLLQFTLLHPTVILRRDDLVCNGFNYDTSFRYSQDFDLWERVCSRFKVENVNIPLVFIRSDHPSKISTNNKAAQQLCSNRVRERQLDRLGVSLSNEEKRAFNNFGSHTCTGGIDELMYLDSALHKIVKANESVGYYNQELLSRRAAELFRWNCIGRYYSSYIEGNYYYKSRMKMFDKTSVKIRLLLLMFRLRLRK